MLRRLIRNPASLFLLVVTLALGIGANTAILTLTSAILWKQLPFREPHQLVSIWSKRTDRDKAPLSLADHQDFRSGAPLVADIAVFAPMGANLTGSGEPERLEGVRATANVFPLLGVQPALGRLLTPEDGLRTVVLSHGLWQRSFGADASIIGRSISLNGENYIVAGILPPDFFFPIRAADFVVPLLPESDPRRADRGDHFLSAVGRLHAGASAPLAEQQLTAVARSLQTAYPDTNSKNSGVRVIPLADEVVGDFRRSLNILTGASGVLLLMALSSLASLSLARIAARQHEFAIRTSLGAGRLALTRQILAETLTVSMAGGLAALVVANVGVLLLKALSPPGLPRLAEVRIDATSLAVNMAFAILTGLALGIIGAVAVSRSDPAAALKSGSRTSAGAAGLRARRLLSAAQLALSVVLLVGAGLLLRSFLRLQSVNLGFTAENALVVRLALMPPAFPTAQSIATFHDTLVTELENIPGVESAGAVSILPLSGLLARADFTIDGRPPASPEDTPSANYRVAGPGYLRAMRIPLVSGRDLADTDTAGSQHVALVSQALARRYWPDGGAVGAHLRIDGFGSGEVEVAGVAGDVRQVSLSDPPTMDLYLPYAQAPKGALGILRNNMYWVIRGRRPLALAAAARRAVHQMQKDVAVSSAMPLEQYLRSSIAPRRFNVVLLAAFAATALLLAVFSVYAVVAHSVTLRTRELGLRMALGAQTSDVLLLVLRQGLMLTFAGAAVGLAAALAVTRMLAEPVDAAVLAIVPALLAASGLLASFIPALRATRCEFKG